MVVLEYHSEIVFGFIPLVMHYLLPPCHAQAPRRDQKN